MINPGRRKRLRREITAILVVTAVVGLGSFIAFSRGCDLGPILCNDQEVERQPSPNGAYQARVYVRDCGATTSWATHVTLIGKRRVFPDTKTLVFVADDNRGLAPQGPAYGPEVRVFWRDDNRLVIAAHKKAMVSRRTLEVDDVRIEAKSFER